MAGRGRGKVKPNQGPRKKFEETYRGKRQAAKEALQEERQRKLAEKQHRKLLWEEGKCVAPDGEVKTLTQVGKECGELGAEGGRQSWEKISAEDQQKLKLAGNLSIAIVGIVGW